MVNNWEMLSAARDKSWIVETAFGLAIAQGGAVNVTDFAACRFQHGLASACVPFHGAAEAGVKVGITHGDEAEFQ